MLRNTSSKTLLLSSLLTLCGTALAGGPADGAYICNLSIAGLGQIQQYIAITGKPDGTSVVVFPATQPSQTVYGYGIGSASNGRFSGTSDRGQRFDLTYTSSNISGTFGYVLNSRSVNALASCSRVF